jgi:3-hydroxyisobutyrate dehydrogenase-like beta-hydroxyacid dehydrogenase
MKLGFIGFGEAAFNLAFGLKSEGLDGIRAFDAMENDPVVGKLVHKRADEAKVEIVPTAHDIAQWADVIIAAVPSTYTIDVCKTIMGDLNDKKVYADVSASTPSAKITIWNLIKDSGVKFADAAMLGSLPKDKHKVPITVSGNGAAAFKELMTPYGMKITLAGEKAGAASAIKLVRSIFMKGIACLMIEMLEAASAYGVEDEVISSISKSMDNIPFTSHLDRLVKGTAIHCKRRSAELKGSISMLQECGRGYEMSEAAKTKMEKLIPYDFATRNIDHPVKGWKDVLEVLMKEK